LILKNDLSFIIRVLLEMPRKGKKMSLDAFQALCQKDELEKESLRKEQEEKDRKVEKERQLRLDKAAAEAFCGYSIPVAYDDSLPIVEVPADVQLIAFNFALLSLFNIKGFSMSETIAAFKEVFEPFYMNFILAPKNFQGYLKDKPTRAGIQEWIDDYAVSRHSVRHRLAHADECWRFLMYVSAETCLKSFAQIFPNWLSISKNGKLTWKITSETFMKQTFPVYQWHGFFKAQEQKKEKRKQELLQIEDDF